MRMEANKTWIDSKSAESSRSGMKFLQRNKDTYPYRSHAQPLLAWLSLIMCMIILLGASGAALWDNKGATAVEVIAGYLAVSCCCKLYINSTDSEIQPIFFVLLFLLLKLNAYGLSFGAWFEQNPQADFQNAVEELNDERERERGRISQKSLRSKGTGQILEREIRSPVN
jgi:hypothetical protein